MIVGLKLKINEKICLNLLKKLQFWKIHFPAINRICQGTSFPNKMDKLQWLLKDKSLTKYSKVHIIFTTELQIVVK